MDVPGREELDCEPEEISLLPHSQPVLLPAALFLASGGVQVCMDVMVLSVPWGELGGSILKAPKLQQAASTQLVCPRNQHIIDVHSDHIHT